MDELRGEAARDPAFNGAYQRELARLQRANRNVAPVAAAIFAKVPTVYPR